MIIAALFVSRRLIDFFIISFFGVPVFSSRLLHLLLGGVSFEFLAMIPRELRRFYPTERRIPWSL